MAYSKVPVAPGDVITSGWGNHVQTQYEEASAEAQAAQSTADSAASVAAAAAPATREINTGTGLSGGGNLTADRTLSVSRASQAQAEAGTSNTVVMTPQSTRQALDGLGVATGEGEFNNKRYTLHVDAEGVFLREV